MDLDQEFMESKADGTSLQLLIDWNKRCDNSLPKDAERFKTDAKKSNVVKNVLWVLLSLPVPEPEFTTVEKLLGQFTSKKNPRDND